MKNRIAVYFSTQSAAPAVADGPDSTAPDTGLSSYVRIRILKQPFVVDRVFIEPESTISAPRQWAEELVRFGLAEILPEPQRSRA
jgi:hypothetical protein